MSPTERGREFSHAWRRIRESGWEEFNRACGGGWLRERRNSRQVESRLNSAKGANSAEWMSRDAG